MLFALVFLMVVAGCTFPGSVKPTVKIGLSAPFEGLYRDLGYEALHAVRMAARERNAKGGIGGRFLVELVALNDLNEAEEAAEQARKMAVDPDVMGVLGGFSEETASVAWHCEQLGLVCLVPGIDITEEPLLATVRADFADRYAKESGGAEVSAAAVWAYSAANRLMDAMDAVTRTEGQATRSSVREELEKLER
ncbi:MAG: ABC transporter substrate-binding protein [Anaerolineae bacterium]|jgi:ABC-type branched-subunit amino acid transport system substrate-binding protein